MLLYKAKKIISEFNTGLGGYINTRLYNSVSNNQDDYVGAPTQGKHITHPPKKKDKNYSVKKDLEFSNKKLPTKSIDRKSFINHTVHFKD